MNVSDIKLAIAEGDLDAVEAEWLARSSDQPPDLDTFFKVADALITKGYEQRASALLEVLDDQLSDNNLWGERLDLIKAMGKHYVRQGTIFETVLDTVRKHYADNEEQLNTLLPTVGLDGGSADTPKLWDKVERLKSLFAYQPGTIVAMKDKGVGRVVAVNLELQTLKIDFERIKGLSVGFRAAGKMLQSVTDGHILHRKLEDLESLQGLKPPALLEQVLTSYGRALTGAEVKEVVTGIIPDGKWSSWWTSARKHSQVVSEGGKKQSYRWASSDADAAESLWAAFEKAKPSERLGLLRRASNQNSELVEKMTEVMAQDSSDLRRAQPELAFEMFQQLSRLGKAPTNWSPGEMIRNMKDPRSFFKSLGTRALRESAYQLVQENREDWVAVLTRAMANEQDAKALLMLGNCLKSDSQEAWDKAIDQLMSQPRKTSAGFTFVAETAAEDEELRERRGPRLLRQILAALADDNLSAFHQRLSVQCDTGGCVPRILSQLKKDEASDVETAIKDSIGLPDYQKVPLLTALQLKFPSLQSQDDNPLYATAESFDAKRAELKTLLEDEIPTNRKAIEVAREMGDLRENFEYKSARQRHEYLSARATELNSQIERASVLDPSKIDASQLRVGTTAVLKGESSSRELTVLGPWESAPEDGIVSFESEFAQGILGKSIGDTLSLDDEDWTIESIKVYA